MTAGTPDLETALRGVRAVPVIRSSTPEQAIAVSNGLIAGGLTVIEVTFSVPDAPGVIEDLASRPGAVIGAGTVMNEKDARDAITAGARFLVSPVWLPWLPALAARHGVEAITGAATPSEIWQAHSSGSFAVKVFPIARLGGAAYVRDILAPMPDVRLMATGGVTMSGARELLDAGCIAVGLGSIDRDATLGETLQERARSVLRSLAA
jgi:2-dehydro-3-deoxyphosphogluconate aldolase/(4S)-4-hydroxy-2-oxoglutarate aldolase